MNPYAAIAAILALLLGFAGTYLAGKHSGESSERVLWQAKVLESENKLIAKQNDWTKQTEKERQNAADREITLRVDIDNLHRAGDGLRSQLGDTARRLANNPSTSTSAYVTQLSDVLGTCISEYSAVSEQADRWEASAIEHHNGWPR